MTIENVTPAPESEPPQTDLSVVQNQDLTQLSASAGPIATVSELETKAKPLYDAILYAMANNMCNAANRSNERIKETLRDAQRQSAG
jgi:hypothetical protein